jgi:hypothetical protein
MNNWKMYWLQTLLRIVRVMDIGLVEMVEKDVAFSALRLGTNCLAFNKIGN